MKQTKAKLDLIVSTLIFGSVGLFVHFIKMDSGFIAMSRGFCASLALFLFCLFTKRLPSRKAIGKNALQIFLSGACIGLNWMLLFESYNYTSVAAATLCYYLSPVFVTLVSPWLLKEKLTAKKLICVFLALLGMVPVSGVLSTGFRMSEAFGILLALAAAVLYAGVIIFNKKMDGIEAMDRTVPQLLVAGIVMLPYVLFTTDFSAFRPDTLSIVMLAVLILLHTTVAYVMYFGSLAVLPAQTAAIISFLAVVTVLLSSVILRENITPLMVLGACLILGATAASEMEFPLRKSKKSPQ